MDDTFYPSSQENPLIAQWARAELQAINVDCVDAVMQALNNDTDHMAVSSARLCHMAMDAYYETVAEQCPDMWPGIVTQLKHKPVQNVVWLPRMAAVAACGLLVAMGTWWVQPANRSVLPSRTASAPMKQAASTVSSLVTSPSSTTVAMSTPLDTSEVTALPTTQPKDTSWTRRFARRSFKTPINYRLQQLKASLKRQVARTRPVMVAQVPPLTRQQRVERDIVAIARSVVTTKKTPTSLDYVFNEAAPKEDVVTLGFAP
jgi:hypothetical protein